MGHYAKVLAIGCAAALGAAVLAVIAVIVWTPEPTGVEVSVEAPVDVVQGERFILVARAKNTSESKRTLVDLDVADSYLRGVVIERTDPPFADATHVPIDNTMSYTVNVAIPGGGEARVTFHAYAAHAGDYGGDIDFCIDSEVRCVSHPVRTIVRQGPR